MSNSTQTDRETAGCAIVIGLILLSIGIGFLFGPAYGFLTIGIFILVVGVLG